MPSGLLSDWNGGGGINGYGKNHLLQLHFGLAFLLFTLNSKLICPAMSVLKNVPQKEFPSSEKSQYSMISKYQQCIDKKVLKGIGLLGTDLTC